MSKRRFAFTLAALALLTTSCGGGGSSGGSGSAVSVAPAPTPSPPPTPTPTPPSSPPPATTELPPAPFGLTSSADFGVVGYQLTSQGANAPSLFAPADEKAALAWSSSLKTYTIALSDLASGRLVYTFGMNRNSLSFSIIQNDGSTAKAYVTISLSGGPANADIGSIFWQTADGITPFVYGRALFGLPIAEPLPTSGRRTFVTDTEPMSAIVFDFATRKVSGTITSFNDGGSWDPAGPKEQATLEPAQIKADGSFVAVISVAGAPTKGELRGRLLGPLGKSLAVYWNAPARDGYEKVFGEWRTVMSYVECSTCAG